MKKTKTKLSVGSLARAALVVGVALSAHVASAVTVATPNPGDLFIGFRQAGVSSDVLIDLGSATNFTPSSLGSGYGGTWNGSSFTVTGINLSADLGSVFTNWANNPGDGTGVTWAVVGITSTFQSNISPFTALKKNSVYVTEARTNPSTQTAGLSLSTGVLASLASKIYNVESGSFGYDGSSSTANSNVTVIQSSAGNNSNSWTSQIGNQSAAFGTSLAFEQAPNGSYSGPTDSVLDLYLKPSTGSTGGTSASYLGSFSLASNGTLTYGPVPEPSTYALLALAGTIFMVFIRRRNRLNNPLN